MPTEVTAYLKNLRIGPRKVRLLADLVTGRPLAEALAQLEVQRQRAARPLAKLLQSAAANAEHNYKLAKDELVVKRVTVDESFTMKRFTPRAFGRATPIRKRGSHVTVRLVSRNSLVAVPATPEVASADSQSTPTPTKARLTKRPARRTKA